MSILILSGHYTHGLCYHSQAEHKFLKARIELSSWVKNTAMCFVYYPTLSLVTFCENNQEQPWKRSPKLAVEGPWRPDWTQVLKLVRIDCILTRGLD